VLKWKLFHLTEKAAGDGKQGRREGMGKKYKRNKQRTGKRIKRDK
jgi:hypothetical protein